MTRHKLLLFCSLLIFLLLALFIRFWNLSSTPASLYYDETDYVITGMSLAKWQTDLSGSWQLQDLKPLETFNYTSELAASFFGIVQFFFPFGFVAAKYVSAFFGIVIALSLAYLSWILSKDKVISMVVMLVALANPWLIHLSRMAYETPISLFFQIWVVIALWQLEQIKRIRVKIIWLALALVSLFLAYFSYHGAKFGLLFLVPTLTFTLTFFSKKRVYVAKWFGPIIFALLLMVAYTYTLQNSGGLGDRSNELIFSSEFLSEKVNHLRQQSILLPFSSLFVNKATVLINEFVNQYVSVFDIYRLFISGYEGGFQFSLIVHGFFYLSGLVFLPFGVWFWFNQDKKVSYTLLALLLVSPLPSAITISQQSIFRSAMFYSLLLILIGAGAVKFTTWLGENLKVNKNLIYFFVGGLFILELVWFGFNYHSRYTIAAIDNHDFHNRLMVSYVSRISEDQAVKIFTKRFPYDAARSFLLYSNSLSELSPLERKQFSNPKLTEVKIGNRIFSNVCPDKLSSNEVWVVDAGLMVDCGIRQMVVAETVARKNEETVKIPDLASPKDSGVYFSIINDYVCDNIDLPAYIHADRSDDYLVTKQTDQEFCQTWVKLDPTK